MEDQQTNQITQSKTNGLAIASLILGIAGFILMPFIASVAALIIGIIALKKIKQSGEAGKGMAITGIVLGSIGTLLFVLIIVIAVGSLAYFGVMSPNNILPTKCTMAGGFSCLEHKAYDAGDYSAITIKFQNNLGSDSSSTFFTATSTECSLPKTDIGPMQNGATKELTLICNKDYKTGDRLRSSFEIEYQKFGESSSHISTGSVSTILE